jgi:hypothetical protein
LPHVDKLQRSAEASMAMAEHLDQATVAAWRKDPIAFIEHVLRDPESGQPFVLSDAERQFLERAFELGEDGRLRFPELVFSAIKKRQDHARCGRHAGHGSALRRSVC